MGHHHHKKGHGLVGHHHNHHHGPSEAPPIPEDCHAGKHFTPEAIITATSRRCKLLGQGGCGRVIAADMPAVQAVPAGTPAADAAGTLTPVATVARSAMANGAGTSSSKEAHPGGQIQSADDSKGFAGASAAKQQLQDKDGKPGAVVTNSGAAGTHGRRVAIKTALPSHSRRSLMAEARSLRLTAHPAIIKLFGTCWSDGLDALVFELLPGGDLQGRIGLTATLDNAQPARVIPVQASLNQIGSNGAVGTVTENTGSPQQHQQQPLQQSQNWVEKQQQAAKKVLTWQQRLLISYQLASALASLHNATPRQILHRDLKPENVLLDGECNARLTDFGIATVVDVVGNAHQQESAAAAVGAAMGQVSLGNGLHSSSSGYTSPAVKRSSADGGGFAKAPAAAATKGGWAAAAGGVSPAGSPLVGSPQASCWTRGISTAGKSPPLSPRVGQRSSGGGASPASHHKQQGHHHYSNNTSAAAEAVLARLAAKGIGAGTPTATPGSSRASSTACSGSSSPATGGAVVQQHGWAGTHDYLDPMYEQLGQLCDKSDVYGLGLIMCQLIMDSHDSKQAKRILQHTVHEKQLHLPAATADWFKVDKQGALAYADLALHCAAADRKQRPTSQQLAAALWDLLLAASAAGSCSSSSSSGGGAVASCRAFEGMQKLQAGSFCFVPSGLHDDCVPDAAAASAAAAEAHHLLLVAIGKTSRSSRSDTANADGSSTAVNNDNSSSSRSSSGNAHLSRKQGQAAAGKLKEEQQQKLKQLLSLTKRIMSVELCLEPNGSIRGGSITAAAPAAAAATAGQSAVGHGGAAGAAAAAYASAAVQHGTFHYAVGNAHPALHSHPQSSNSHSLSHTVGGSGAVSCSGSGVTASPVAFRVLGGLYSLINSSIVFCCRCSRSLDAGLSVPRGSSNQCSIGSSISSSSSLYVFEGQYISGKLLGSWQIIDAATVSTAAVGDFSDKKLAAAVLRSVAEGRPGSSSSGSGSRDVSAAASYDWVMYHSYLGFGGDDIAGTAAANEGPQSKSI